MRSVLRFVIEHVFDDGHVDRVAIGADDLDGAVATVLRRADALGTRGRRRDDSLPILLRLCEGPVTRIAVAIVNGGLVPQTSRRFSAM